MPEYYPVYLNLSGKRCVIFGGGTIAEGKIKALRQSGAQITIISPDATPGIKKALSDGEVEWLERKYQTGDLEGAFIAIAATNVPDVNREIFKECESLGILLNAVDDPPLCTFIAPSIVKREPVTLAISTGGASPALARKMRETLSEDPNLRWADLANVLQKARGVIKQKQLVIDPDRWQCCITDELLELAQNGLEDKALEVLIRELTTSESSGLCHNLGLCDESGCSIKKAKASKEKIS